MDLMGVPCFSWMLITMEKRFDMDRTVFAKDIGESGEVKLAGLMDSVVVIAIDKHGNESKPFIL